MQLSALRKSVGQYAWWRRGIILNINITEYYDFMWGWKYPVSISCQYKLEVEKEEFRNLVSSGLVQNSNSRWVSSLHEMAKKNDDGRPSSPTMQESINGEFKGEKIKPVQQFYRMTRRLPSLLSCSSSIITNEYESLRILTNRGIIGFGTKVD